MRAVMGGNGRYWAGVLAAAAICGTAPDRLLPPVSAQSHEVLLATTTSTRDAGLLDSLIPVFERTSGYKVKVIAVGIGQALEMGRRGDADVVLAHAPEAERVLVDSGYFVSRRLVMHNDFLIVGPAADPAHLGGMTDALAALRRLAEGRAPFVSRGDQSGTHKLERKLWRLAGIRPPGAGGWYIEAGHGMGETLQMADEKRAYTITDRATYLAWRAKIQAAPLGEGDPLHQWRGLDLGAPRQVGRPVHDGVGALLVRHLQCLAHPVSRLDVPAAGARR